MAILYNYKEHLFANALLNCSAKQENRSAKCELEYFLEKYLWLFDLYCSVSIQIQRFFQQ